MARVEVAAPGFVNLALTAAAFRLVLGDLRPCGRDPRTLRRCEDFARMAAAEHGLRVGSFTRIPEVARADHRRILHGLLRGLEQAAWDPRPERTAVLSAAVDVLYEQIPLLRRPPQEVAGWLALFEGVGVCLRT